MTNILLHGDCMEAIRSFADKSIDHVFTSPPYNRKRNDKYEHYDDRINDYFAFIKNAIEECVRVSKGYVIINIQKNYYNKKDVFKLFGHFADKIVEVFIWEKSNPMPAQGLSITNAYEFFLVLGEKALKSDRTYTKNILTTGVHSSMPKGHKAVMKPSVALWFIERFTKPGDIVLDPFAGIGTTAVSCINLGRRYIMIEKEKEYFDFMKNNISTK